MLSSGLETGQLVTEQSGILLCHRPYHTARVNQAYLCAHNVQVLDWPSLSPSMNPVERLRDELGRHVQQQNPQPQTVLLTSGMCQGTRWSHPLLGTSDPCMFS